MRFWLLLLVGCARPDAIAMRFAAERNVGTSAAWLVVDAETGEKLSGDAAHQRMLPASVTKLVSSFVALALLGADYRFETALHFDAPPAPELRANLIVTAGLDPSFASPRFESTRDVVARIADAFVAAGVKRWRGDVTLRDDPDPLYGPGWTQDDLGSEYGPPATAFYFAENTRTLFVDRGTQAIDDVTFVFRDGRPDDDCRRRPHDTVTRCVVDAPVAQKTVRVRLADAAPMRSFAQALGKELQQRGVVWETEKRDNRPPLHELLRIESPPLRDLVRVANKLSLNVYADAFAFIANRSRNRPRTFHALEQTLAEQLQAAGLDTKGAFLFDGSGLSRYNALSPELVVALIRAGITGPFGDVYLASLSIAGRDGTLKKRARDSDAAGFVFAKTGTLKAQRGLAGVAYRPGKPHPLVAFAFFVDHHLGETNALLDELMRLLVTM